MKRYFLLRFYFNFISILVEAADAAKNPLPTIPLTLSYECDIEQNSDGATVEIKEWYIGLANEARSQSIVAGTTLNQYVYPNTMELLDTIGTQCTRLDLNTQNDQVAERTPFLTISTEQGLRVVGGTFGILDATKKYIDTSLRIKYLGNMDNIRGIPTRKWVGCLFDKSKVKTTKVLIWYSDNTDWTPAHTVANKTVPVQVEISSKIGDKVETEVNSILRYREKTIREESIYVSYRIILIINFKCLFLFYVFFVQLTDWARCLLWRPRQQLSNAEISKSLQNYGPNVTP